MYLSTFPLPAPPLRLYLLAYDLPDAPDAAELESENRAFENLISLKVSAVVFLCSGVMVFFFRHR